MPIDPREQLLDVFPKAPEQALALILHGLQTGYLDPAAMPGTGETLWVALWKKVRPHYAGQAPQYRNDQDMYTIRLGAVAQQSPAAWIEATGRDAWVAGPSPIALDALAAMAEYSKDTHSRKNNYPASTLQAPKRWVEEMMQALPELPPLSQEQRQKALLHAVMVNSQRAIERFLDPGAFLDPSDQGKQLRRILKNTDDVWPQLLAMGIADHAVGDAPFWFSVVETAGENGVASPTVVAIEAWAFANQRWETLEGKALERGESWRQKTLATRLEAARIPTDHLLLWLANTPVTWTTAEGLSTLPSGKAQALRVLVSQHHQLWEVPAHAGRAGWVQAVAQHPQLAPLANATPAADIAIRGATLAFINAPDKANLTALIAALHGRNEPTPLPGLWRQAWGHNHIASVNWNAIFEALKKPRAAGVLAAWRGDPTIEAPFVREAFLEAFPLSRKFDLERVMRKAMLLSHQSESEYGPLAQQWVAILGQDKKVSVADTSLWERAIANDPAIGQGIAMTTRVKGRDNPLLRAFHRSVQLATGLPVDTAPATMSPRF